MTDKRLLRTNRSARILLYLAVAAGFLAAVVIALLSGVKDYLYLLFLATGAMSFTVDLRRYDLFAGSLTITRPWQLHKLGHPNIGPGRLYWLILDVGVRRPNQEWRWPNWVMLQREDLLELGVDRVEYGLD